MKGYVDEYLQPKLKVKAKGLRKTIEIEAVIDTGFDAELCLPLSIAVQLGLELTGGQYFELADGTVRHELLFAGEVILEAEAIPVEISVTEAVDALIGVGLLRNKILKIDFPARVVSIADERA